MHYGEIITADPANGPGIRLSLFVSGCTNHCRGCFQPETWDFNYGPEYTEETEERVLSELKKDYYQGLTILGGEPMEPENQPDVAHLIMRMREDMPDKDIWVFTGFTFESDLLPGQRKYTEYTDSILDNIDVLVDGKFILEKKNLMLRFRGSENQRIIDMKKSRRSGKVVLSPLN